MIGKELREKIVGIAVKQLEASVRFKQTRMEDIQKNEDLYYNKTKPAGRGRFNVPIPMLPGFVDTLMSKIDDAPSIQFKHENLAHYRKGKKIGAAWMKESGATEGRWDAKDRATKKLAILSGRAIYQYYAESEPKYSSHLEVVDHNDFQCEPLGGEFLEDHKYLGKMNVFRTKADLEAGVKSGRYISEEVAKLLTSAGQNDEKRNKEIFQNKIRRYQLLGLDPDSHTFAGQPFFNLVEWCMDYEGKRYYLFFEYGMGIAIRADTVKKVFGTEKWPFTSWSTHTDAFNFWSKAPCDDIRPVAEAVNIIFNQALDNRQKRNFGMRAVDSTIFEDLSELEWRPDGIAMGNTNLGARSLREGVYEFQTPEISGTIDMIKFMDDYTGTKSGITADTQGESEEKRVGIYYGNLQQVSDRLGLYNKSYSEAWAQLGMLYAKGVNTHMTEGFMVKIIGEEGQGWEEEVTRDDADVEFEIEAVGGQAEIRDNDVKKQNRRQTLVDILNNINLGAKINPTWAIKELLRTGDYEEEEIQSATDVANEGDIESMAKASRAIQDILMGKEPKEERTANTVFVKRIIEYAIDKAQNNNELFNKLMDYGERHIPIAAENALRKAQLGITSAVPQGGAPVPPGPGGGTLPPAAPPAGTPAGTASASADISNAISPPL